MNTDTDLKQTYVKILYNSLDGKKAENKHHDISEENP